VAPPLPSRPGRRAYGAGPMPSLLVPAQTVHAPNGMVSSSDQLATQAGVAVLARGGSAADAAIAANAVLAATGPHLCGMGGDLFALVHDGGPVPAALNASGRAGSGVDAGALRAAGHSSVPFRRDLHAVTVPGCVDGWMALHERYGRLALADVLAAAIGYAEDGFPASPLLVGSLARLEPPHDPHAEALAAQASRPGERVRRPGVARTLRAVAAHGRAGFYEGEFGDGLLRLGAELGQPVHTPADLARPQAEWVAPLRAEAWARNIWTIPPNSQGYLALAAAWIATTLAVPVEWEDPHWPHLLAEAAIAASFDRPHVLHDGADGTALVDPVRLAPRAAAIRPDATLGWPVPLRSGDTTYLCAADARGQAVSLIQSNASGFGSWLWEPSTGINLHNRGLGFSLDAGHPAELAPGRRPPHTLAPLLVTQLDGSFDAVLGTQGGDGQPQILLQLLAHHLHPAATPGRAVAAPRFVLTGSGQGFDTWTAPDGPGVLVEGHAPAAWVDGLAERGHRVQRGPAFDSGFGHACLITRDRHGMLLGAADPRAHIGSCAGV
jgi:gamma-glutamyltranspeptidase / glutathione hydrolase